MMTNAVQPGIFRAWMHYFGSVVLPVAWMAFQPFIPSHIEHRLLR